MSQEVNLNQELIETPRSPSELGVFVESIVCKAKLDTKERHHAFLKKGKYKQFIDELVPLSIFSEKYYLDNDVQIKLVLGNQPYDAEVSKNGKLLEKIELTCPQNGKKIAKENRNIVNNGFSENDWFTPGDDLIKLIPFILKTCDKKSKKNYESCLLVISIDYSSPFEEHELLYKQLINCICEIINGYAFNSKMVFLLEAKQGNLTKIK